MFVTGWACSWCWTAGSTMQAGRQRREGRGNGRFVERTRAGNASTLRGTAARVDAWKGRGQARGLAPTQGKGSAQARRCVTVSPANCVAGDHTRTRVSVSRANCVGRGHTRRRAAVSRANCLGGGHTRRRASVSRANCAGTAHTRRPLAIVCVGAGPRCLPASFPHTCHVPRACGGDSAVRSLP